MATIRLRQDMREILSIVRVDAQFAADFGGCSLIEDEPADQDDNAQTD